MTGPENVTVGLRLGRERLRLQEFVSAVAVQSCTAEQCRSQAARLERLAEVLREYARTLPEESPGGTHPGGTDD
ncbi:hypothetical protein [Actinopolyspora mortivallis]|uniref:Uncharacterized protein n=1 Tax=Actinopolyspora mortivallis TaxID=33906 RepID=A0A2T0GW21_ACTMO|nr:hypothetical protein [Actinopolyspora mortivallis]PRW63294.1 hypothetical protein CEP50_10765 [Actinopolyspora mortivallis]